MSVSERNEEMKRGRGGRTHVNLLETATGGLRVEVPDDRQEAEVDCAEEGCRNKDE